MEKDRCAICFDDKAIEQTISHWKCGHGFCDQCCNAWDGLCPICRSERLPPPIKNFEVYVDDGPDLCCGIFGRKRRVSPLPPFYSKNQFITPSTYEHVWQKIKCKEEIHHVRLEKALEGVLGTCQTCGEKEWFAYMG